MIDVEGKGKLKEGAYEIVPGGRLSTMSLGIRWALLSARGS